MKTKYKIIDELKTFTIDLMFKNGFSYTGEDINIDGDYILMFGDKDIILNFSGIEDL